MKVWKQITSKAKKIVTILCISLFGVIALSFDDNYFEVSKNLDVYATLLRELNLYYVDDIKPGEMVKTSIDAMLEDLDPYTNYIPESKIEDYRVLLSGEYGGIGAIIVNHGDNIVVTEPYDGYPAAEAGLKAGDIVVEADGILMNGKTSDQVSDVLKGNAGSQVHLKVDRAGEILEFTLERQKVKIPDVPFYGMVDDKTGYIKLTGFTETAAQQVYEAYEKLKEEGMTQLVFDLRGNGGGLLVQSVNIVNMFVPRGQEVVSTKGKVEKWNRSHVTLNQPVDLEIPIVVLVNGGSASASEIVSGSLQDLDRAVVLGHTTYGKGLVQQPRDLSYGAKLKVTIAKYYTPSGRCIQKIDYSNRGETGDAEEVPDSLVTAFTTSNGRKVFDGRGIEPDIKMEEQKLSNIGVSLLINHLIFDYSTEYARKHESIAAADEFSLSDADYNAFVSWVMAKEFDYDTKSMSLLTELEKVADDEQYKELASAEFAALRERLSPDKADDLSRFKKEIKQLLEDEIVSRYYLRKGRIMHALSIDPFIDSAIETLNDTGKYNSILGK